MVVQELKLQDYFLVVALQQNQIQLKNMMVQVGQPVEI